MDAGKESLEGTEQSIPVRQGDLWAWIVSFVVNLSLDVGIVLFASLAAASFIYALATGLAPLPGGIRAIPWSVTVLSLIVLTLLVKRYVRGFRPYTIHGIGRIAIKTTGCEWGEIAADVGAGLIGLSQAGPLIWALIADRTVRDASVSLVALFTGLFLVIGWGSLCVRLRLCGRRTAGDHPRPTR